jgi:hypothetical protein
MRARPELAAFTHSNPNNRMTSLNLYICASPRQTAQRPFVASWDARVSLGWGDPMGDIA